LFFVLCSLFFVLCSLFFVPPPMPRYPIPAAETTAEHSVSNSRFLAIAAHTPSVDAARELIARMRTAYPTANHHCYAFLVGYGSSVTAGMSDDGEPSGTAGRPMLDVLRGSGLGDITVVVTRYFGGTKLGTGGLVRAYGDATKAVLALLPRSEKVELATFTLHTSYAQYATVRHILEEHHATIYDETFADSVAIAASLPLDTLAQCSAALTEATAGQVSFSEK
jgi:uncharacterized YigZ family protein